ncbi:DUF262 domain-containing protein [Pectobacterium carotovorum]|uniref:DUF262 domain-containing protein n=1 Tax=Pectobacterium carotovorum TaxID=554 RepID=UPI000A9685F8|nr:DUF262 domain-containing protein [Pectobacterium carotovorum]
MQISFDRKTITNCLQQNFVLPTFQRDYKWELKHLQDLMSDIQDSFFDNWEQEHGRRTVLGYAPYFLGTIIVTPVADGANLIVDGQQRITTLTYILCYFHRMRSLNPEMNISSVDNTIRRQVAGENSFNLNAEGARKQLFDVLMDDCNDEIEFYSKVDSIVDKDPGTVKIWSLYQKIDSLIDSRIKDNALLPHFLDYLTECVYLFQIGVDKERDGHKVFVTMNDRGLKLSPIDLLKGFLLSGILEDEQNQEAHNIWTENTNKLNKIGIDEDSNFFKTWLRSKYAETMRGKKKGDESGDFEVISDSYHRWVIENKENLNLNNSDDFFDMITKEIKYHVDTFSFIKECEKKYNQEYPYIFFNGARDFTSQAMVILSALNHSDSTAEKNNKIKILSYYLDFWATCRTLDGKANTYDNVRDLMFNLCLELRGKAYIQIRELLLSKVSDIEGNISKIVEVDFESIKRQELLRLLGRLADYLERGIDSTSSVGFETYSDRTLDNRTFDIEHLISDQFEQVNEMLRTAGKNEFTTLSEFNSVRNNIGGLILLPRGRNRSMKDMMYIEKLERYSGENILAQTLCEQFYLNQPNYNRFREQTGIECAAIPVIDKDSITIRANLYKIIADKLWSSDTMNSLFPE